MKANNQKQRCLALRYEPTELQYKIASIIGTICTEGIPGTSFCDTGESSSLMLLIPVSERSTSSASISLSPSTFVCNEVDDEITPPSKRRRTAAATEKRDVQADELLKVEKTLKKRWSRYLTIWKQPTTFSAVW